MIAGSSLTHCREAHARLAHCHDLCRRGPGAAVSGGLCRRPALAEEGLHPGLTAARRETGRQAHAEARWARGGASSFRADAHAVGGEDLFSASPQQSGDASWRRRWWSWAPGPHKRHWGSGSNWATCCLRFAATARRWRPTSHRYVGHSQADGLLREALLFSRPVTRAVFHVSPAFQCSGSGETSPGVGCDPCFPGCHLH